MKNIAILAITVCVLLVAGCTTTPATTTPSGSVSPGPTFPGMASLDPVLPMDGKATLGSGNNTMEVSLYNIEVDPSTDSGIQTITINVLARNTGTTPRKFVWFSKLTNTYGNSFGGIGISHRGSGARSAKIPPGMGEIPRDYIEIHSAESFATLSKGAVLDVYFMERTSNETSMVPDYHVAWTVNPGVIR
ncbi:MAG: hypothetical protein Q7V05_11735 [Methanoregula sp.]|nr:hypothetical protein [Methanoregula sp.]